MKHGPRKNRGRREDRVRAAPAVSRANRITKNAHEHTGSAETLRPSLRSGFTAYFVLSPVTGLSCRSRAAPLCGTGWTAYNVIWISEKPKYFFAGDWTGQISLIALMKLDF